MAVDTRPPPWWWRASDGRWYPPDLRPGGHAPPPKARSAEARQTRYLLVSAALAIGILAAATGLGVIPASSSRSSEPGARAAAAIAPEAALASLPIWFQPQPPGMIGPFGQVASADYLALF